LRPSVICRMAFSIGLLTIGRPPISRANRLCRSYSSGTRQLGHAAVDPDYLTIDVTGGL
jgi:hypothetical protein